MPMRAMRATRVETDRMGTSNEALIMTGLLYVLFFCSGLSGLIYQVVWVRMFGNVFGNTILSASLVVAIFMLGLGAGSYLVGAWADRRYASRPDTLLRTYGQFELAIAAMGPAV